MVKCGFSNRNRKPGVISCEFVFRWRGRELLMFSSKLSTGTLCLSSCLLKVFPREIH